jgi:tetratricopeptide (TPR) repeat protein
LQRAYEHMNHGDDLLGQDRVQEALEEYRTAAQMAPQIPELPFWHAVTLADLGRMDEALPLFRGVFERDPNLATLVQRLPASGLLRDDEGMMSRILSTAS